MFELEVDRQFQAACDSGTMLKVCSGKYAIKLHYLKYESDERLQLLTNAVRELECLESVWAKPMNLCEVGFNLLKFWKRGDGEVCLGAIKVMTWAGSRDILLYGVDSLARQLEEQGINIAAVDFTLFTPGDVEEPPNFAKEAKVHGSLANYETSDKLLKDILACRRKDPNRLCPS